MIPHTQNKGCFFFPPSLNEHQLKALNCCWRSAPPLKKTNPEWKAWKTGNIISKLRPPQCKTNAAIFSERNPKYWACVCMHMRTGHTHTRNRSGAVSEPPLHLLRRSLGTLARLHLVFIWMCGLFEPSARQAAAAPPWSHGSRTSSMERWRDQSFEEHCKSCFRNEISVGWFLDEHALCHLQHLRC